MPHSFNTALASILAISSYFKLTEYLEIQHFWTLRLRLSTIEHWLIIPSFFIAWIALTRVFLLFPLPPFFGHSFRFSIGLVLAGGIFLSFFEYVLPAYHARGYLQLRWKAWSGPSRTGIKAELVPYIGDQRDWETLEALSDSEGGGGGLHPIERFSRLAFPQRRQRRLIVSDITSLLLSRANADHQNDTLWVPQSSSRESLFQPILPGEPASLLWGEHIGFQRRCSRGILSVPRSLLNSPWPKLAGGVDARGLCLAFGVLARNKGLHPSSFICHLDSPTNNIERFEHNTVFWPYPAKTLRSIFRRECKHYFSQLGSVFVTIATELALLLTDAPVEVAQDWLQAKLEHQDIQLNNRAFQLGAEPHELELLYRGHYAAMLVSLAAHRVGVRIRPEVLVYKAVCKRMGVLPGVWTESADIGDRSRRELEILGPRVERLIEAVV